MSAQGWLAAGGREKIWGMGRAMLIIGGGALLLAIWVYAILDAVQAESSRVRTLPKGFWVAVTIVFPLVGSGLWFWLGRPRKEGFGSFGSPVQKAPVAPDDDPDYLRFLEARARREREDRERQARKDGRALGQPRSGQDGGAAPGPGEDREEGPDEIPPGSHP